MCFVCCFWVFLPLRWLSWMSRRRLLTAVPTGGSLLQVRRRWRAALRPPISTTPFMECSRGTMRLSNWLWRMRTVRPQTGIWAIRCCIHWRTEAPIPEPAAARIRTVWSIRISREQRLRCLTAIRWAENR